MTPYKIAVKTVATLMFYYDHESVHTETYTVSCEDLDSVGGLCKRERLIMTAQL